jgi:translocation and assembly module TamB
MLSFRRKRYWMGASLIVLSLGALGIAWAKRDPIAKSYIDDELRSRGVTASYDIKAIGTKRQRFENIVIGDPARPDLTAAWAEIDTSLGFGGATVRAVRAGGVRLRGRLADGVLSFGSVDKLLPAPTGEPIKLPDLDIALRDAVLSLGTPFGGVGVHLAGSGNPSSDFKGRVAIGAPALKQGSCGAQTVKFAGELLTKDGAPFVTGPLSTDTVICGAVKATTVAGTAGFSSLKTFDRFGANIRLQIGTVAGRGVSARSVTLGLNSSGTAAKQTGDYRIATAGGAAQAGLAFAQTGVSGTFSLSNAPGKMLAIETEGAASAKGVVPDRSLLARASAAGKSAEGTPVGPAIDQISRAVAGLSRGSDVKATYRLDQRGGEGGVIIRGLTGQSVSGAKFSLTGDAPVDVRWPGGGFEFAGVGSFSGGGFPESRVTMNGRQGTAIIAPMVGGGSRLALSPVRFGFGPQGLRLDTVATLDGPVAGGRVTGLTVPLAVRPGQSLLSGCHSPRFSQMAFAGLTLSPATVPLCVSGNEVSIASPRLNGRVGTSPISFAARSARYNLAQRVFGIDALAVRMPMNARPTLFNATSLTGSLAGKGLNGRYSGASGQIGPVPLLMTEGAGSWTFDNGVFATRAAVKVADANADYRFNPLISDDFNLRFANGVIRGDGTLRAPKSGMTVSRVTIDHRFSDGTGQAVLGVDELTFGQALQPDELTPITLGVIANVSGSMSGEGRINWTPRGVKSTGSFRTNGLDMAAAFGPVTGMNGEIRLSDLLGLETEPGQVIKLGAVNPGIAVLDGEVIYRLLPGLKAQVSGGRWPFAGGFLILEPTLLDLNQSAERRLTFRVEGLDMSRFIAAMEFENVAATGTFDGTLPMVFDKDGGRIVGGRIVAREGGTLSYVGDISNENIGSMARFAFDALKSIKYNRLAIDLDGAIDGDVITRISFSGVNQAPINGVRAKFPIPVKVTGLNNIPFIFNITITAKFRQLFEMARSFNDPSVLINRILPQLEPVPKEEQKPVQPPESRPTP